MQLTGNSIRLTAITPVHGCLCNKFLRKTIPVYRNDVREICNMAREKRNDVSEIRNKAWKKRNDVPAIRKKLPSFRFVSLPSPANSRYLLHLRCPFHRVDGPF